MSKTQTNNNYFAAYQAMKAGESRVSGAKDGSLPTKPTVPCRPLPEAAVLQGCLSYLKSHRIVAWRMNVGAGRLDGSDRFHTYGVPGSGDILAVLPGGRYCEIECKAGKGGRRSKKQQDHSKEVLTAGGVYVIVHGVEELTQFLEDL